MKKVLFITGMLMLAILANAQTYTGVYRTNSDNTTYHHFTRNGGGATVYMNQQNSSLPILRLSGGTATANHNVKFTFESNGRLGIGTIAPTEKLDVRGHIITNHSLKLKGEYGLIGRLWVNDYANGTDYLILSADGSSSHMKIGTNGNVIVDGTIKAEEIVVEDVAADFVFEDGYNLRSLEEVESFINENNHLPDVAPASETTQGINVSEFNTLLLQKIEELTLYIIEQDKSIAELRTLIEKQ